MVRPSHYEPLMPIFNAGFNLVPGSLWLLGDKPSMYNPSAWYLTNVLGFDASEYEWGIGLGGVGAAYLYGGFFGVFILYMVFGLFFGYLLSRIRNAFLFGGYTYFLMSLPFALYRMDETFLFGVAIVVVPFALLLFENRQKMEGAVRAT
jgi:hypothetical protein